MQEAICITSNFNANTHVLVLYSDLILLSLLGFQQLDKRVAIIFALACIAFIEPCGDARIQDEKALELSVWLYSIGLIEFADTKHFRWIGSRGDMVLNLAQ